MTKTSKVLASVPWWGAVFLAAMLFALSCAVEFANANTVCPHCKKPMVLRVAHRGPTAGSKFWGCANYPVCHHTQPFQA